METFQINFIQMPSKRQSLSYVLGAQQLARRCVLQTQMVRSTNTTNASIDVRLVVDNLKSSSQFLLQFIWKQCDNADLSAQIKWIKYCQTINR